MKDKKYTPKMHKVINSVNVKKFTEDLARFPSENPSPVLRISKSGIMLYQNESVRKILKRLKLPERQLAKILPERINFLVAKSIRTKKPIQGLEVTIGKYIYSYSIFPVAERKYANLYAHDITERKRAEIVLQQTKGELEKQTRGLRRTNEAIKALYEELEASNKKLKALVKLKNDFISTVSHELRTPLSITKEGISIVLDEITGPVNEKQKGILATAKDSIDRLARIINDLLDISKIESGKIDLERSFIDISHVIKDVVAKGKLEADKKGQSLKLSLSDGPINVCMDRDKITQVLTNLVYNAIKYTPHKGKIAVRLREKKGSVEVAVSDNGIGIVKEDQDKVFDEFQQLGRTAGPGAKGTGLGLAIVKKLVVLHGGRVWVKSGITKGSVFTFSLPKLDIS